VIVGKGQQVLTPPGWHNEEDLSFHNLSVEDATGLALDRSLLAASGAMH